MKYKEGFKEKVVSIFRTLKFESDKADDEMMIPINDKEGNLVGNLRVVSASILEPQNEKFIKLLADWRDANNQWFPAQFKVTLEGTKKWTKAQLIDREDRILFWIQTLDGDRFGHIGLSSFNFSKGSCEIDNIMRGKRHVIANGIILAFDAIRDWAFDTLGISGLYATLFDDNRASKILNIRCGLRELYKVPLRKVIESNEARWEEMEERDSKEAERFNSVLYMKNPRLEDPNE